MLFNSFVESDSAVTVITLLMFLFRLLMQHTRGMRLDSQYSRSSINGVASVVAEGIKTITGDNKNKRFFPCSVAAGRRGAGATWYYFDPCSVGGRLKR